MPNAWVTFLKQYAQENNISYGCAIAEAGPAYRKMKAEQNQKKQVTIIVKKQKKQIEENPDIISNDLQQLLFISGNEKIKKALMKMNYKGRLQTNPVLRNLQIIQNFNTPDKMKELIQELKTNQ